MTVKKKHVVEDETYYIQDDSEKHVQEDETYYIQDDSEKTCSRGQKYITFRMTIKKKKTSQRGS